MRKLVLSALILASAFQAAMGEQAGDWTYSVKNGQATIAAYTGTGGAVAIPSEVNGIPVVKVGDINVPVFGWEGNENSIVNSVTIPNSVTSIGNNAFAYCKNLTSVTIPNSVTSIGEQAFVECTALTSVTIPNSLPSVGNFAFSGCTGLTTLTISNGVISIGNYAFLGCTGLTTLTIPNSVTSIREGAFCGCTGLTSVTIPNSVTSIGFHAFLGCTSVKSVTMSDRFIAQVAYIGISGELATDYLVNALANNDAFVTAVANKIKATSGNYGIATQSGVTSSISSVINEGRIAGVASVTASPNTWSLFTTSQIQNMAVGDLVLTRQVSGGFVLNYDIEQSTDLQTWTTYAPLSLPLTGLPTDKAFVRIKVKGAEVEPPPPTNNAGGGSFSDGTE